MEESEEIETDEIPPVGLLNLFDEDNASGSPK